MERIASGSATAVRVLGLVLGFNITIFPSSFSE